jgi:DNA-directed RNA polymerase specialized sigma24 family protein
MPYFNETDPTFREFMKRHEHDFEVQAIKLSQFYYGADVHDILSRTVSTLWEHWHFGELSAQEARVQRASALAVMRHHTLNLSRKRRSEWTRCRPVSDEDLQAVCTPSDDWHDILSGSIISDNVYAIYRAISKLPRRQKDVMTLLALGFDNEEIKTELGMTASNFTTTLHRARKTLRKILQEHDGERTP